MEGLKSLGRSRHGWKDHVEKYIKNVSRIMSCLMSYKIEKKKDMVEISTATGYGLNDQGVGVQVPKRERIFSSPCHPGQVWGPPSVQSNGYEGLFPPRVKWMAHEADHSPVHTVKDKKTWIYTATPHTLSWHSAYLD
jgi:hypothetical protein